VWAIPPPREGYQDDGARSRESRPGASTRGFESHLQDEARAVWELTQSGIVREIYFRESQSAAVIVLEVAGVAQAEEVLARLPLVRAGLTEFEVIGLRPYPGFSRLFGR
jgi:hypothetical protein